MALGIESFAKKNMLNWKHFLIYLAIGNARLPKQEELEGYKIKLLQKANDYEEIEIDALMGIDCWIDEIIGMEEGKKFKRLVFGLLRVEVYI